MSIHLRRPSAAHLESQLDAASTAELTYDAVGASLDDRPTPGLTRRRWQAVVGPASSFDAAVDAIFHWRVQEGSGLLVRAEPELRVGTNVAMAARIPIGWVDLTCRVVEVVHEPDRAGFAYGTLPTHVESGEESFVVTRDESDTTFTITAVARVTDPLGRLVRPVADHLQARATDRYLEALRRAISVA